MSHTDELKAFLVLMSEIEDSTATKAVLNLLQSWEKRTSEQERKEAFLSIGQHNWRTTESAFRCWVLDQKILYPQEVKATVAQIGSPWNWSDTSDIPNALRRLTYVAAHTSHDRDVLALIDHMGEGFFKLSFKTQANTTLFQTFIDTILNSRPHLQNVCMAMLPATAMKKLTFSEDVKKEYELQNQLKRHLQLRECTWSMIKQKIVPLLALINPERISDDLNDQICQTISQLPFEHYLFVKKTLVDAGWNEKRVGVWARPLNYEEIQNGDYDNGWMAHWAKHHKKALLKLLGQISAETLTVRLEGQFEGYLNHFADLSKSMQNAGITLGELNTYLMKHPKHVQEHFYPLIEMWCETRPAVLAKCLASSKDKTLMIRARSVLPDVISGAMDSLAYLGGYTETAPANMLPLIPLSDDQWDDLCYSQTAETAYKLQQKYIALQQKTHIAKHISVTPSPTLKRKM